MGISKQIEDLENFLLDNPELEKLEASLSQFNVFEILKMVNSEIRHSNVLAWLLNPSENHGLGDYFLKQFLRYFVVENKSALEEQISLFDLELFTYSNVEVRREWKNIDILLLIDEIPHKIAVAIENKIKSTEHSNQLQRYRNIVKHEFHDYIKLFIFLTPEHIPPSDDAWYTVYQKKFLEKKDFEDSSFDEITGKISRKWEDFIKDDLPRIHSHFESKGPIT